MIEGVITPGQAVKAYHDALTEHGISPQRPLEIDLQVTEPALLGE